MNRIVILDTNVLLADPNVLLSYPRAEIVIPETVLGELDKLKTARVDPDLRFRGREVSRLLFELSEDGSLIEGVDLPDGGRLRIATLDSDKALPEGLSTRNADEKILATAFQVCASAPDCDVTLVTNDLNMLLKAQTFGVKVERHGEGVEGGFARRFIIRPFQRYRIPLTILAIALAVFAAVIAIAVYSSGGIGQNSGNTLPPGFKETLTTQQSAVYDALVVLQDDPNNPEALLKVAEFHFDQVAAAKTSGNTALALTKSQTGIRYYTRYLENTPNDSSARADFASLLFYGNQVDRAITEVTKVLESEPNHINANFNLAIFLLNGSNPDLKAAADQVRKVISLTKDDSEQHAALQRAQLLMKEIETRAKATGQSIGTTTTEAQ